MLIKQHNISRWVKSGVRVTEYQHALRLNGVLDLYKRGKTVYDHVEKKYYHFNDAGESSYYCDQKLLIYQPQPDNKLTDKGAIGYKQFKNNRKKQKW